MNRWEAIAWGLTGAYAVLLAESLVLTFLGSPLAPLPVLPAVLLTLLSLGAAKLSDRADAKRRKVGQVTIHNLQFPAPYTDDLARKIADELKRKRENEAA